MSASGAGLAQRARAARTLASASSTIASTTRSQSASSPGSVVTLIRPGLAPSIFARRSPAPPPRRARPRRRSGPAAAPRRASRRRPRARRRSCRCRRSPAARMSPTRPPSPSQRQGVVDSTLARLTPRAPAARLAPPRRPAGGSRTRIRERLRSGSGSRRARCGDLRAGGLIALPAAAEARPGDLDPSFGGQGKFTGGPAAVGDRRAARRQDARAPARQRPSCGCGPTGGTDKPFGDRQGRRRRRPNGDPDRLLRPLGRRAISRSSPTARSSSLGYEDRRGRHRLVRCRPPHRRRRPRPRVRHAEAGRRSRSTTPGARRLRCPGRASR